MAQFGPDIDEESFGEEEAFSEFDENNIPDFGEDEEDSLIDPNEFAEMDGLGHSQMVQLANQKKQREFRRIEFDQKLFTQIREAMDPKSKKVAGFGTFKKCVHIFADCVAEGTTAATRMTTYQINDINLMNSFVKFMLEEYPDKLLQKLNYK